MTNHTFDSCFKKHGFPPYWKQDGTISRYAAVTNNVEESPTDFNGENK